MATLLHNRTDSNREAKCQRTRFRKDADVSLRRSPSGKYSVGNVIQCGKMTCPACGVRRARRVASSIGACIVRHMEGIEHDVWMLTLSPPHRAEDALDLTVDRLYLAAADFFRSAAWRRFERDHDVCTRVRVFDATHGGANGSHPHFHIALFPRYAMASETFAPIVGNADPKAREKHKGFRARSWAREEKEPDDEAIDRFVKELVAFDDKKIGLSDLYSLWQPLRFRTADVRAAYLAELAQRDLVDAWRSSCARAGIAISDRAAFDRHALTLSPSEDAAAYFTKWGLADEVACSPQKHRSHLRLLDLVEAGHDTAGDIYRAFREAVEGKQWVSGLGDAMREIGVHDEDADAFISLLTKRREKLLADAGTPVLELLPLDLHIRGYLYPAALQVGWENIFALCDFEAERASDVRDVQSALDRFLWSHLGSQAPPFAEEHHVSQAHRYCSS